MYLNRAVYLFFLSAAIAISLLTAFVALTTSAMASSKGGGGGGGAVAQVKVNSGDPNLDKEVNKFYNCISKTHQDPPTIDQIYTCYYQSLGGSGISTSNYGLPGTGTGTTSSSTTSTGSTSHHHKHGISTTTPSNDVITGTAVPVLPTSLTFNI